MRMRSERLPGLLMFDVVFGTFPLRRIQLRVSTSASQSILRAFFEFLAGHFVELDEQYEKSGVLAQHTLFVSFGLADSALAQASDNGLLILTDDLRLYAALEKRGTRAINFNHLRMGLL
jgi:hypothetical protein